MSQPEWKNDTPEEMPPMDGAEGATEEYAEIKRPKVNTSTLALIAAFSAGLIVLYLLGLQNKPRTASADETARRTTRQCGEFQNPPKP